MAPSNAVALIRTDLVHGQHELGVVVGDALQVAEFPLQGAGSGESRSQNHKDHTSNNQIASSSTVRANRVPSSRIPFHSASV